MEKNDQMANGSNLQRKDIGIKRRQIQSLFNLPSDKKPVICSVCSISYHKHQQKEVDVHKQYHDEYVNGIKWPTQLLTDYKIGSVTKGKTKQTIKIVTVDKSSKKQVLKTERLLQMVNKELNASLDSQLWKDLQSPKSKAFILAINNRAVGICTTDAISELQGRWMICKSQEIVPNQVNQHVKVGISRIWVAPSWRRLGLAELLLGVVQSQTKYGVKLKPSEIAFSQPSTNGGLLARKFNGIKHKSGEMLIPVYID